MSRYPWKKIGSRNTIYDNHDQRVCTVTNHGGQTYMERTDLIAAAPELLEACKLAHRFMQEGLKEGYIPAHAVGPELQDAIAKAEGRTVEKSQADGSQKPSEAKDIKKQIDEEGPVFGVDY